MLHASKSLRHILASAAKDQVGAQNEGRTTVHVGN